MMTQPPPHPPVRLLIGMSSAEPSLLDALTGRLALEFGVLHLASPRWQEQAPAPGASAHSIAEFLTHQWLVFSEPLNQMNLPAVKRHALRVEQLYTDPAGRLRIRLDVAGLDSQRVLRATAADAPHRIYLGDGVYGEVILVWRPSGVYASSPPGAYANSPSGDSAGHYAALPWTRPRDAAPAALEFLARVREDWLRGLRQGPRDPGRPGDPGRELTHG